jgi:hypothetical protein
MSNESVGVVDASDTGGWRNASRLLFLVSTLLMLSYEYVWSRFTLRSLATSSFGTWFWVSCAITTPWGLGLTCLTQLREAVKNGKLGRDDGLEISVWVQMIMLAAYLFFGPAVHRLPSLGALQ